MYQRKDGSPNKPRPFVISIDEVCEYGKRIYDFQGRSLFYFTYLMGCRITEALATKKEDVEEQVKGAVCSVLLKNLKNKLKPSKTLPIILKGLGASETYMSQFTWDWIKHQDGLLFKLFTPKDSWVLFKQLKIPTIKAQYDGALVDIADMPINPHYLRHCRLTHLATIYGLNSTELQAWAGWTSGRMTNTYIQFDWQGLTTSLMSRQQDWSKFAERMAQIEIPKETALET